MYTLPKSIETLISRLSQLPGIGPKTASRLAFYMVRNENIDVVGLADAFANLKRDLVHCGVCHNISDTNPCSVCRDDHRERNLLCVVEEPLDVIALERANFRGLYHVLGGKISPLEGIGPAELNIESLVSRVKGSDSIREVIIATNPDVEGEATAAYLVRTLAPLDIKVTRLARGLPMGGELEYADELTLARALEGRNELIS